MSIVKKIWGRTAANREKNSIMGWLDSSMVLEQYVQPMITGNSVTNWLVGISKKLQISAETKWVSLGCGSAGQEIFASKMGLFAEMDAFELSPQAINIARKNAKIEGIKNINFNVGDFNDIKLKPKYYDVALMVMSLHHVENLEALFKILQKSIKENGLLIVNEYIGPSQMQFTPRQLSIVSQLLDILPEKYRYDYTAKQIKQSCYLRNREEWNNVDPSEAIRSDEIVPLMNKYFIQIERIDYGGTILNPLLENIIKNFHNNSEDSAAILNLLIYIEKILIQEKIITSDFAVMVMRNVN